MYREHFGLAEPPFSIAPDPRYLYLSDAHREALAHLLYGVRGDGGFVLLTGEVGTGKTTICRCLLEQLPEQVQVALVLNPALNIPELLATICDDLGVVYPEGNLSNKVFIDALNRFLLDSHSRGLTTVLIVDEAQNLAGEVLEQLRLLTNLETNSRKLLQIILIGQPELRGLLERNDMRQITQRVTARYHLGPLDLPATRAYLNHRLAVAGARHRLFSESSVRLLQRCSRGIPRLLNVLADRALLGSYTQDKRRVDARIARKAAKEVLGRPAGAGRRRLLAGLAALIVGLVLLTRLPLHESGDGPQPTTPALGMTAEVAALSSETVWSQGLEKSVSGPRPAEEALLGLWGVDPTGRGMCKDAGSEGLECLEGVGSLSLLRRLDRPTLLELQNSSGKPVYAALVMLEGDRVMVQLDGRVYQLTMETLLQNWLGHFTLLWRPAFPTVTTLRRGAGGGAVAWLDRALPRDETAAAEAVAELFDERLEKRVKRFQVRQGLLPDGIAGPQTLILLNQKLGSPGPRLIQQNREG